MKPVAAAVVLAIGCQLTAGAGQTVERELERDVVLRAMVDELNRSMTSLGLADLERPYFIEYALLDAGHAWVSARLGAVTGRNQGRSRWLRTDVRVGSYELDNSNFSGGYGYGGPGRSAGFGADVPIEDDYHAIRQAIWWATDRDYKQVVEQLAAKKAFMESKMITDKPDDFSREPPSVYFEERFWQAPEQPDSLPELDLASFEELAIGLSAVFREYPDIRSSGVSAGGYVDHKYLVNSEGTRLRTRQRRLAISVTATVQAEDGMELSDSFSVYARQWAELPDSDELMRRCHQMARQLVGLKDAPILDNYTGPVLFEAEPAAMLFWWQFGSSLGGGQRPVGSATSPDDLCNKLNKRILPRFLNVIDDPLRETLAGMPVLGHYLYDDQGVKAEPVEVVRAGRLKALLMSRNPSKEFQRSNGHGRGLFGPQAAVGCLIVTADPATDAEGLKRELLEACEDEGLEYGLRVASLGSVGGGRSGYSGRHREYWGAATPLMMYKVYPDGREELVRGAEIARIDLKAFKRILAAGDTPYVFNAGWGTEGLTVAAPALVFEELDLAKIDRDFDKPPVLPAPLAR